MAGSKFKLTWKPQIPSWIQVIVWCPRSISGSRGVASPDPWTSSLWGSHFAWTSCNPFSNFFRPKKRGNPAKIELRPKEKVLEKNLSKCGKSLPRFWTSRRFLDWSLHYLRQNLPYHPALSWRRTLRHCQILPRRILPRLHRSLCGRGTPHMKPKIPRIHHQIDVYGDYLKLLLFSSSLSWLAWIDF